MPTSATTIGQRFTQLIQQLGLSKNAFAQSLDRTATVIQHLVDERNKPGYDLLCRVFEVYSNVSKDWLLLGQGPMLLDAATPALLAAASPSPPVDEAIDMAAIAGPPRRRAASAVLQPAEVAATVALAATQAAQVTQPTIPEPVAASALPSPVAAPSPIAASAPEPAPVPALGPALPAAPDPAYLAALLQAQHVQHQLALSEQRNQHLLEQQQLLQQMVQLLQKNA